MGFGIALAGGVESGRISVRLGYEYTVSRMDHYENRTGSVQTYAKPSMLFCVFGFNF